MGTPFAEIALVLLAAALVGAIGTWLRQPLIVSFIAVGILVGPTAIGLVTQHDQIELLASIGIALLLFVVGLNQRRDADARSAWRAPGSSALADELPE